MKLCSAVMAVFGFWLIFGGVGMVEMSHDWYGMMMGLLTSLIGTILMLGSAMLTAETAPEWLNRQDDDV